MIQDGILLFTRHIIISIIITNFVIFPSPFKKFTRKLYHTFPALSIVFYTFGFQLLVLISFCVGFFDPFWKIGMQARLYEFGFAAEHRKFAPQTRFLGVRGGGCASPDLCVLPCRGCGFLRHCGDNGECGKHHKRAQKSR